MIQSTRVKSTIAGIIVDLCVVVGEAVKQGQVVAVIESMKMEHEVRAGSEGYVAQVFFEKGDLLQVGSDLVELKQLVEFAPLLQPSESLHDLQPAALQDALGSDGLRSELQATINRHAQTKDSARAAAVAKRYALGMRTARENIADLCDANTFVEYGALAYAAQESRRSKSDLIANSPADGVITGIATVGGMQCAVIAYDASVLAGTQGIRSHQKTDRLLDIARAQLLPVILFAEGGGGRPGDVDMPIVAGLHVSTFAKFAKLSGRVSLIGIAAGRCFAGNAALFACCDVLIACAGSNIGMGGPAMIQGGGLGQFIPEQIGPAATQSANGVIDILAKDEAHAVAITKQLLSTLHIKQSTGVVTGVEQNGLRDAVPSNRLRAYDPHPIVRTLLDIDSVLEIKADFGLSLITVLGRIGGQSVGLMANNCAHIGGAIDPDAANKAAWFMQLCQRYQLPIISLIDTPGFMVGPNIEAQAQVRFAGQLFLQAAKQNQKFIAVVLRKGYGLGAMAMAAGGFHECTATIAWPTAEFGAMGLEGAVRLGFKKELEALEEGAARDALFAQLLNDQIAKGNAIRMAETLEIDAIIDPARTRDTLLRLLNSNERNSKSMIRDSTIF